MSCVPSGAFQVVLVVKKKKKFSCQGRRCKRHGLHPWVRRSPEEGHGNPLQYSYLKNPMDRGVQRATVHRGKESDATEVTLHCTQHTFFICPILCLVYLLPLLWVVSLEQ